MLKKLLDFDEICFEGAIVEEERRVGPGGQVFELSWLPEKDVKRWREKRAGKGETLVIDGFSSLNHTVIKHVKTESMLVIKAVRIKCGTLD